MPSPASEGLGWWISAVNGSSDPLTKEDLETAFENLKRREEEWRRAPKGPCGCPACVVSPKTYERLKQEGGWALCANCFNLFHIELVPDDPDEDGDDRQDQ